MSRPFRILILDATREPSSFGSPNLFRQVLASAPAGAEILVRRAPDRDWVREERPEEKIDALVLSGSVTSCLPPHEPWLQDYDAYLIERIRAKRAVLGVCFGHQAIARCLFSMNAMNPALSKSSKAEVGWQRHEILSDSPLFEGLSRDFYCYQSHYEEVVVLPPGARHLARSSRCELQAFELEGAPVYGIQFHPEHGCEYGEAALQAKLAKGEKGDWILNPGKGPQLYDANVGKVIFGNFFKIAQSI